MMTFDRRLQRQILEGIVATILSHAAELTKLDRAIGDGDHGINLERGFRAVEKQLDALAAMPFGAALTDVGKRLVMTVGGASGPLFGTFFMALGMQLSSVGEQPRERSVDPAREGTDDGMDEGTDERARGLTHEPAHEFTREEIASACEAAVAAVKARGKSDAGQKTMLDVLIPVQEELRAGGPGMLNRLRERAASAAALTIPMVARRGRASFLGERSAGHMDPGARSSELMIVAVCESLQTAPQAVSW
jgi:dihydroxyacetone kinase-like protein